MPTQLTNNSAIYFICARDFTYDGVDYKMGDEFEQDLGMGRIDLLVRTRRIIPVVDDISDKPRHWHHHVRLRSEVSRKLGLIHRENTDVLEGESLFNREKQHESNIVSVETTPAEPSASEIIKNQAHEAALTKEVLDAENAEHFDDGCVGEHDPGTNPDCEMAAPEPEESGEGEGRDLTDEVDAIVEDEEEDDQVTEEDLFDPSEHTAPEVHDYLSTADETERQRVLAAERNGKNRKGIVGD